MWLGAFYCPTNVIFINRSKMCIVEFLAGVIFSIYRYEFSLSSNHHDVTVYVEIVLLSVVSVVITAVYRGFHGICDVPVARSSVGHSIS